MLVVTAHARIIMTRGVVSETAAFFYVDVVSSPETAIPFTLFRGGPPLFVAAGGQLQTRVRPERDQQHAGRIFHHKRTYHCA